MKMKDQQKYGNLTVKINVKFMGAGYYHDSLKVV